MSCSSKETHTVVVELDLVVHRRRVVAEGVVELTLRRPDGAALPSWEAGAHIDLVLGPDLVRQYSLCGDPADRCSWRIAVLREHGSRGGSAAVHDELAEGSQVRVRGPRNHFRFEPSRRYVLIAGGIGITPIMAMAAAADDRGADWSLTYGGRTRASMAYADELRDRYGARIDLRPQDEFGLLDLDSLLGEPAGDTLVYCCGPEPLLEAVEKRCAGWPRGALHVERFSPKEFDAQASDDPFEVVLARSGRTVTVSSGQSILSAVREAGVQVLSSCEEGTCGTCETTVLAGEVDHRDSLLSEEERAAGETMMVCVSRAACAKLTLDL